MSGFCLRERERERAGKGQPFLQVCRSGGRGCEVRFRHGCRFTDMMIWLGLDSNLGFGSPIFFNPAYSVIAYRVCKHSLSLH